MPIGDRLRRHPRRRLVRSGETYASDELDRGEITLELPPPTLEPPPEDEQAEPWNARDGDSRFAGRLQAYQDFLREHGGGD